MSGRYLNQIRTGGEVKQQLREIMYDVAEQFDVQAAVDPRPVPHITLFGSYDTDQGRTVKQRLIEIFEGFDAVPYRIDGFDVFRDLNVVYFDVISSEELRSLRRAISRELRSICHGYPEHDTNYFHDFHITLAFKDIGGQLDEILEYAQTQYDPQFDCYATRVTSLDGRSIMWEYDIPKGKYLKSIMRPLLKHRSRQRKHLKHTRHLMTTTILLHHLVGFKESVPGGRHDSPANGEERVLYNSICKDQTDSCGGEPALAVSRRRLDQPTSGCCSTSGFRLTHSRGLPQASGLA
jgi:2''-5'' RNA ligase